MSTTTMLILSENERQVLTVVKEYLNKNRVFEIAKIIPFIHSRFKLSSTNINNTGIREILKSLVKKRYLLEGSKLTKETVLSNLVRNGIFEYISVNPGIYFSKILKYLNLNNYTLVWHIDILEKFQFIKRELFDNRYIYYESSFSSETVKKAYYSSKEKSIRIINYLKADDTGITKTLLAQELNMHPNTITQYLNMLESLGLVQKEVIQGKNLYFLN